MKHVARNYEASRSPVRACFARLAVVLVAAAGSAGCAQRRIPDGPPLQIHRQFTGDKFTYNSPEEESVWEWFQLDPAFASTLEGHPRALEEARKAKPFRTAYWIATVGSVVFSIKSLNTSLSSRDDPTTSAYESAKGDLVIAAGFWVGMLAFDAFSRRYVNRAVSLFNVEEMRSTGAVELAPAYLPARGVGIVGRLPLR